MPNTGQYKTIVVFGDERGFACPECQRRVGRGQSWCAHCQTWLFWEGQEGERLVGGVAPFSELSLSALSSLQKSSGTLGFTSKAQAERWRELEIGFEPEWIHHCIELVGREGGGIKKLMALVQDMPTYQHWHGQNDPSCEDDFEEMF